MWSNAFKLFIILGLLNDAVQLCKLQKTEGHGNSVLWTERMRRWKSGLVLVCTWTEQLKPPHIILTLRYLNPGLL